MSIGKLEQVQLSELWNGEATDFTQWLAKEENVAILGDKLGIDLEVQEPEKPVARFSADLLCKDTNTGDYVVIVNHLERTDHSHLGQLVTYAAGLDAVTIIWIAKSFTAEHRASLDWLNKMTDDKINFIGIEIKACKIGKSLPAPIFDIVVQPSNWERNIKEPAKSRKLIDTPNFQLEYWEAFNYHIEDTDTFLKGRKPAPTNSLNFQLDKHNFWITVIFSVRDNFIRIDLNIDGGNAKEEFHLLKEKYEKESKKNINENILWKELPNSKRSQIQLSKNIDVRDRELWLEQHEWLIENLEKFDNFFRPLLKEL